MAVKKLSQFTPASAPPAPADTLVGILGGVNNRLFSINQLRQSINYLYQNIKDDWGAVGDGVANDTLSFKNFQTFGQAQTLPVVLVIPPGTYNIDAGQNWFQGIADLTVIGYGAKVTSFERNGPFFQSPLGVNSARIVSTVLGAGSVFLITPSQHTIFTVGTMVAITSFQMQGVGGYPPNWYFCEYKKITAKNTSTGEITLDGVITYPHLSTYPEPNISFGSFSYDVGGPASIFNIRQDWVQNLKIYGLTIIGTDTFGPDAQYAYCKDMVIDTTGEVPPSMTVSLVFDNCLFTKNVQMIEVDKDAEYVGFFNCRIQTTLLVQSASTNRLEIDGCDIDIMRGTTAKQTTIRNSHIRTFNPGSFGYGTGGSLVIENSQIDDIGVNFGQLFLDLTDPNLSFANGSFICPYNVGTANSFWTFGVPGTMGFCSSNGVGGTNWGSPFVVLGMRQDASFLYIDTTLNALPTFSVALPDTGTRTLTQMIAHPCRRLTVRNCTGSADAIDMSKFTADAPLYSYSRRLLAGNVKSTTSAFVANIFGTLVKIRINVLRAYTGAHSALNIILSMNLPLDPATGIFTRWGTGPNPPSVDVKVVGERLIVPGSTTGTHPNDFLTYPAPLGAVWFTGPINIFFDQDTSADTVLQQAVVDFEMVTDQGITAMNNIQYGGVLIDT